MSDTTPITVIEGGEHRECDALDESGLPCLWVGNVRVEEGFVDMSDGTRLDKWTCPKCGWLHDEKVDLNPDPDTVVGGHDDIAAGIDW